MIDGVDLAKFYSYAMERFDMLDFVIMTLEEEVCYLRARSMFNAYTGKYDWKTRNCSIVKAGDDYE